MKTAIAQINTTIGDFESHFNKMVAFAEDSRKRGCELAVFPEMVISGYPPRDLLEKKDFIETNLQYLKRLIETINGIGVICGYVDFNPNEYGNPLFNSAILFENGKTLHRVEKRLLPTYDVFDERRFFEAGVYKPPIEYKGHKLGLTVCEDIWNDKDIFPKRYYDFDPVEDLVNDGADLIINISASPYHTGRIRFRKKLLGSIAKKYEIPLIYANQVGGNDSVLFDGVSLAFDGKGEICARAKEFGEDMVFFDTRTGEGDIHPFPESDTASMYNALVTGTRDYVKKCGFKKAVIGLSGGIDSALTACIAAEAMGKENVNTLFMPSRYTSKENHLDTQALANNLGIEMHTIAIDDIFHEFLKYLSPAFKKDEPDVTEQNIQARIRGTILMAMSNKHGSILLTTGNKSEMAIGYCTLYGDMSGGLAIISDVPKTSVYELARYINREKELIPERIIDKPPSAELKPDQLDEDELPPYEKLDPILKGYIEDMKGGRQLIAEGFDKELVREVIIRVDRNEYKRKQAPPGLRVTSKAFGYGRRYPIAQLYTPEL